LEQCKRRGGIQEVESRKSGHGGKCDVAFWLMYNSASEAEVEDAEAHRAPLNSMCSGGEWLL
jgi:hypothetical protein